jgi:hypothetical protein
MLMPSGASVVMLTLLGEQRDQQKDLGLEAEPLP